ncbi:hypothetical protein A1O1_07717 [Capronia coronata CBS 617.96]|uniref:Phenylalanine ammonia-lyase n=1 Tax=Capronia coronata CBS 617.96 TaxID=1182541 RepID=W9XM91_9EURO|nr:uncharacterized protein A1O1_07717 [Capronia coronata CBS 617.96]EXJ81652.1 hypothetical protein A1O1_07717 [Capronia coronata CBS 617.96]
MAAPPPSSSGPSDSTVRPGWGPGPTLPSTPVDPIPHLASWSRGQQAVRFHLMMTLEQAVKFRDLRKAGCVDIDGEQLDIPTVVAVAKYGCKPCIAKNHKILERMLESQSILREHLEMGNHIYGVNTGFGGSADTRTDQFDTLQIALMQHQQSAILGKNDVTVNGDADGEHKSHSMPTSWVRGAMLVRVNTTLRGHSSVRTSVVNTIAEMIRQDMVPIVPMRGSISASGDLMPLSYIAGALQGNPDIHVRVGKGAAGKILTSGKAIAELQRLSLEDLKKGEEVEDSKKANDDKKGKKNKTNKDVQDKDEGEGSKKPASEYEERKANPFAPVNLGPKEGLALVNGTAPSAGVAALALFEVNQLAVISQMITCLSSEALAGNVEWAHPFIAEIRPLPGQMEAARNMRYFLRDSSLVSGLSRPDHGATKGLVQDRYATRSAPQWIGPALEDLWCCTAVVNVELNSTTDNPVVSIEDKQVYCGANFQATSVAVVMDKARLLTQLIGKMLFSQATELINPATNKGLPPNLAADNPSLSFCMKGVDINMAGYQSELAWLANPVTSHSQSAEMHNQSINSLAMISARSTMHSVEILSMMTAAAIYVGLQAVDLRAMHTAFMADYPKCLKDAVIKKWQVTVTADVVKKLLQSMIPQIRLAWYTNAGCDLKERCERVSNALTQAFLDAFLATATTDTDEGQHRILLRLKDLKEALLETMPQIFEKHRHDFSADPAKTTLPMLGHGTKALYQFVRGELGVPFHRGIKDDPMSGPRADDDNRANQTIGSWISIIYEAVRDGRLCGHIMTCVEEDLRDDPGRTAKMHRFEGPEQAPFEYDAAFSARMYSAYEDLMREMAAGVNGNSPSAASTTPQGQPAQPMPRAMARAAARAEAQATRRKG